MVTGSHNPADYNGFKLLLKGRSVFGAEIQEIGQRAASGHWHEGSGTVEEVDIREAYVDRLLAGLLGQGLPHRLGRGQRRRGADPRHAGRPPARPSSRHLQPGRRHLPQPSSRPDGRGQPRRPQGAGRARAARFRHRLRRRRRPHRRGRRPGPRDLGRPAHADPRRAGAEGAARRDDHRRRQGEPDAVRRHRRARRQAADVEDRPQPDQVEDEGDRRAARGRDERPHLLQAPLVRLRRRALRRRAADRGGQRQRPEPDRDHGRDAQVASPRPSCASRSTKPRKFAIVEEVRDRLSADGAKVDATDGVRVSTDDGWWLLRASNTQDVLVARAEAKDEAGVERLVAQIDDQLAKSGVKREEAVH